jgi:hypothetical protein
MFDCDIQRKNRSLQTQRARNRFCTLDIEIEKDKHLDVRSDRGLGLAPRGFCLANTNQEGRVSQHTLGATSRSGRTRLSGSMRSGPVRPKS